MYAASPTVKLSVAACALVLGLGTALPSARATEPEVLKALPAAQEVASLSPPSKLSKLEALAPPTSLGAPSQPVLPSLPLAGSLEEAMQEPEAGEAPLMPLIYQAVVAQDLEALQAALKAGYPVDEATPEGDTALCAAVWTSQEKVVAALLEHGANHSLAGKEGQKPVALASLRRNRAVMTSLLEAGADANTKFEGPVQESLATLISVDDLRHHLRQDRGVTALMACAARGDVENAVTLMQHKANTEVSTRRFSRYALDFAAEQRYLFLMRVLLGRPADSEPDLLVTVNLSKQRAWIEKEGKIIDMTTISTGREGYGTPPGRYVVTDKHRDWTSTLYKASMPWFMRLNCSAIGLHAGYVTGHPASHGCIRLPEEKARQWFKIVGVGDEVQIIEN